MLLLCVRRCQHLSLSPSPLFHAIYPFSECVFLVWIHWMHFVRSYGTREFRNECFCGFSWRCVAAGFARNYLIANAIYSLGRLRKDWAMRVSCRCLLYDGVPLALTSNVRTRESIMHHCIAYKLSAKESLWHTISHMHGAFECDLSVPISYEFTA